MTDPLEDTREWAAEEIYDVIDGFGNARIGVDWVWGSGFEETIVGRPMGRFRRETTYPSHNSNSPIPSTERVSVD